MAITVRSDSASADSLVSCRWKRQYELALPRIPPSTFEAVTILIQYRSHNFRGTSPLHFLVANQKASRQLIRPTLHQGELSARLNASNFPHNRIVDEFAKVTCTRVSLAHKCILSFHSVFLHNNSTTHSAIAKTRQQTTSPKHAFKKIRNCSLILGGFHEQRRRRELRLSYIWSSRTDSQPVRVLRYAGEGYEPGVAILFQSQ